MPRRNSNPDILRNKGELTKFQILVEVLRGQPHVKQKDIADALGVTVQAVSKYFKKLVKDGLLEAGEERAYYKLTPKAHKKLQEYLTNVERYVNAVKRDLKVERVWPAIAAQKIRAGERVGLVMRNGVLYAVLIKRSTAKAYGTALNDAEEGEDVALTDLRGEIELETGKILIIKLPSINEGGSRAVDLEKVRRLYEDFKPDRVGVMGSVGRAVLNKLGVKADIEFGISKASAMAALRGLKVLVLVVGRMVNRIVDEIELANSKFNARITYEVIDVKKPIELLDLTKDHGVG
ncbi:winged helix-turn-helix transcriptional regulator [Candidatus Bathyarchaeota archaeon]|nr:winged helix-turn-helix transcriptional regulator [Candidatus Bathyarchaeota archaeon]